MTRFLLIVVTAVGVQLYSAGLTHTGCVSHCHPNSHCHSHCDPHKSAPRQRRQASKLHNLPQDFLDKLSDAGTNALKSKYLEAAKLVKAQKTAVEAEEPKCKAAAEKATAALKEMNDEFIQTQCGPCIQEKCSAFTKQCGDTLGDIGGGIADFGGDIGRGLGDVGSNVGDFFGGLFGKRRRRRQATVQNLPSPTCDSVADNEERKTSCLYYANECPCVSPYTQIDIESVCPAYSSAKAAYTDLYENNKWILSIPTGQLSMVFSSATVDAAKKVRDNVYMTTFNVVVTTGRSSATFGMELGLTKETLPATLPAILMRAIDTLRT
ncbi:PREDICTED: uncharacterized protein LOC106818513 isoform X2 [Priapulus caudatus]|uniref:Uncharacterized protein LOC106818513 isoform X2 n=1 Tax=Priapulus caudatus TaxID=37621 RepID=A0ABM1F2M8_PRICU|nr:PREDICTED: uncharacterized protein LOC106818513 isoform X2 [Priapulus caudatus]